MKTIRVLFVDNRSEVVELYQKLFERFAKIDEEMAFEFQGVIGNMLEHPNVMDKVKSIAVAYQPHVAIVDLAMLGAHDDDLKDEEHISVGLNVCNYLKQQGTRTIILSGFLDVELTARLKAEGVDDWALKNTDFRKTILPKVLYQAKHVCAAARKFTVNWPLPTMVEELAQHERLSENTKVHSATFNDLLSHLFKEETNINVDCLGSQPIIKTADVIRRAPVFRTEWTGGKVGIVKFAPKDQINIEHQNYVKYVRNVILGGYHASYDEPVFFWNVGVISANFIGDHKKVLPNFLQHYRNPHITNDELIRPMRHFFEYAWKHYDRDKIETIPAGEYYQSYITCYPKFTGRLESLKSSATGDIRYNFLPQPLPDPIGYVWEHQGQMQLVTPRLCVTHGDLHCLNLLVDGEKSFIIDFEYTGKGPWLRDFAHLESDVYIRLLADEHLQSLEELYQLSELTLTQSNPADFPEAMETIVEKPHLMRAYHVIRELRNSMKIVTNYDDVREYFWTLLLQLLYRAGRAKERQSFSEDKRRSIRGAIEIGGKDPDDSFEECLLVAGVITKRLQEMEKAETQ